MKTTQKNSLPCLLALYSNANKPLPPDRNKRIQRYIAKTVPSQLLSLFESSIWLNMKWIFEIRAASWPNNYCIKTNVTFVGGRQMRYLAKHSLTIAYFFYSCIFPALFFALIKPNSRMLNKLQSSISTPMMYLPGKRHISTALFPHWKTSCLLWTCPPKYHVIHISRTLDHLHFHNLAFIMFYCFCLSEKTLK